MDKPKLVIVSDYIRRDLQAPFVYFDKFEVYHLYNRLEMSDLDLNNWPNLIKYEDQKDLYHKIVQINPDVIQGPEPYATKKGLVNTWVVVKASRRLGRPFYFPMIENRPPRKKFNFLVGSLLEMYLRWYGKRAKAIIHLNLGAKENLIRAGIPKSKIFPTRWACWVDSEEFKPFVEKKIDDEPILFFVGRVIYQKGVLDVVDAYEKIIQKAPQFKLVIAGSGDLLEHLKEVKEKNKLKNMHILGFIENRNLPKYFNEAYLTITPSITVKTWEEQVGLINLQSLSCGTPVISTKSGAIPEYVPDDKVGILVDEKAPDQIAEAVLGLYNNPKRYKEMVKLAREYVLKQCNARDCIQELEVFLQKEVL